ncbi:UDP-glucuronic acid decarboxylase 1 [Phtheirospermum japonicum]|uniref:UDP-glucuronate decarboxylase n=1 Tax=Phtheirospermum japonicum TaxID=374723 RepID=A0A830BIK7_9LAMI|nr:UDP-glucuronic acid decarboxylase 1 [Phtheirospermum japonicum]
MPISQTPPQQPYSPKSLKHPRSLQKSLSYLLKEQRLLFILVGILIGAVFFLINPSLSPSDPRPQILSVAARESFVHRGDPDYESRFADRGGFRHSKSVGRVPTNVMGTLNMLGLAKRIGARFLLTSTSEVRIARIFNTYGPRMCLDDGRVVSNFVSQAIRKQPMTVYGDGKQTRSFQYVSDLVNGLVALMEGEHVGPFNLGNPGEFTMLELAEVVKETIDPSATIEFRPNTADDPHKRKPDISKAKDFLNWEPKISLRDGLPRMVDDFRNRILNEDEGKGNK